MPTSPLERAMKDTHVFSRVLVATDFSSQSERAWRTAWPLAERLGAELLLVHVLVWEDRLQSLEAAERRAGERSRHAAGELNIPRETAEDLTAMTQQWAERTLEEWAQPARAAGVKVRTLLCAGTPYREIVAAAQAEGADLIVMGRHGRGEIERLLLGSVSDRVARTAFCPRLLCA